MTTLERLYHLLNNAIGHEENGDLQEWFPEREAKELLQALHPLAFPNPTTMTPNQYAAWADPDAPAPGLHWYDPPGAWATHPGGERTYAPAPRWWKEWVSPFR